MPLPRPTTPIRGSGAEQGVGIGEREADAGAAGIIRGRHASRSPGSRFWMPCRVVPWVSTRGGAVGPGADLVDAEIGAGADVLRRARERASSRHSSASGRRGRRRRPSAGRGRPERAARRRCCRPARPSASQPNSPVVARIGDERRRTIGRTRPQQRASAASARARAAICGTSKAAARISSGCS